MGTEGWEPQGWGRAHPLGEADDVGGEISGKMAPKGARSRQLMNGGRALEASCYPWEQRTLALLRLLSLSSPPTLFVLDQEPLGGVWAPRVCGAGPQVPQVWQAQPCVAELQEWNVHPVDLFTYLG